MESGKVSLEYSAVKDRSLIAKEHQNCDQMGCLMREHAV
jgi:hypothetical protein